MGCLLFMQSSSVRFTFTCQRFLFSHDKAAICGGNKTCSFVLHRNQVQLIKISAAKKKIFTKIEQSFCVLIYMLLICSRILIAFFRALLGFCGCWFRPFRLTINCLFILTKNKFTKIPQQIQRAREIQVLTKQKGNDNKKKQYQLSPTLNHRKKKPKRKWKTFSICCVYFSPVNCNQKKLS